MTFLPIVQREMRAAARRKATYRLRWLTGLIAILATFFTLAIQQFGGRRAEVGHALFMLINGYAFTLCVLAGLLLTADCLSEEKREGTLGLLFLTDLKGYDVVFGKFMGKSMSAFYSLLAILPITGIPLLIGGVTGTQFWLMMLAQLNILFFMLAAGVWVSSLVKDSRAAVGGTLSLLAIVIGMIPALARAAGRLHLPSGIAAISQLSPLEPYLCAVAPSTAGLMGKYWGALAGSHLLGWGFLAAACIVLPNRWQEGSVRASTITRIERALARRPAEKARTENLRKRLLARNPISWLAASGSLTRSLAWLIVVLWGLTTVWVTVYAPMTGASMFLNWYGIRPFGFLLKLLFTFQACNFFAEARRNGALEMLLCTPLTNQQIIGGQFAALRRTFLAPILVFLAVMFVPVVGEIVRAAHQVNLPGVALNSLQLLSSAVACVRQAADFLAIAFCGMRLALTMKKPNQATAMTALLVIILPSFVCILDFFVDLFFIFWGAMQLPLHLRRPAVAYAK